MDKNVLYLFVGACVFVLFCFTVWDGTYYTTLSYCLSLETKLNFSFSHQTFRQSQFITNPQNFYKVCHYPVPTHSKEECTCHEAGTMVPT